MMKFLLLLLVLAVASCRKPFPYNTYEGDTTYNQTSALKKKYPTCLGIKPLGNNLFRVTFRDSIKTYEVSRHWRRNTITPK